MTEALKPFTEDTLPDADAITRRMFGASCLSILKRILANPLRRTRHDSAGDVVYLDGRAMGFQATIARTLHFNGTPFVGIAGSTLAMHPEANPVSLMHLMKASIAPRSGGKMFYANTSNPTSMKMNRMLGVKGRGPDSCARIRFALTWWPSGFRWLAPPPKAKRMRKIDVAEMDDFWNRYLATSKGLVSSRTGDELAWIFGDALEEGVAVMLGAHRKGSLAGYVVFKYTHGGRRAMLMDWIALRDDSQVLDALLASAVRHVRKHSSAFALESIGFNERVQPILRKHLPFCRKAPNNSFIYQTTDANLAKTMQPNPVEDWFFGPYDGDRCFG